MQVSPSVQSLAMECVWFASSPEITVASGPSSPTTQVGVVDQGCEDGLHVSVPTSPIQANKAAVMLEEGNNRFVNTEQGGSLGSMLQEPAWSAPSSPS
jgi:hypothetical protein